MVTRDIVQRLLNVINDTRRRVNTLESREYVLLNATQTLTNKTLTAPTIGDFSNAQHSARHESGGADEVNHDSLAGFVADEHVAHSGVTLTAGNGLTGGGTIAASRTFAVGAGDGITVNADDVALTTPGTLTVSTSNTASGSHTHAVTSSSNPGAAASLLATDATGDIVLGGGYIHVNADHRALWVNAGTPDGSAALHVKSPDVADRTFVLEQISGQTAQILRAVDSSGNPLIVMDNTGKLQSGTPSFVSGQTGWEITPTGDAEFNNIWARGEFHASVFVMDEFHASGGTLFVATAAALIDDVTTVTAAGDYDFILEDGDRLLLENGDGLDVSTNTFGLNIEDPSSGHAVIFNVGDVLRCKTFYGSGVRDNWMKVVSVRDNTAFYTYYVTLESGTAGLLPGGSAVVSYGAADDGRILLTGDQNYAPYIDIFTSGATPWNGTTPHMRIGRLDGTAQVGTEQYGFIAGADLSDGSDAAQYIIVSNQQVKLHNVPLEMYNGANQTVLWAADGSLQIGTDVGSPSTTLLDFDVTGGTLDITAEVEITGNSTVTGTLSVSNGSEMKLQITDDSLFSGDNVTNAVTSFAIIYSDTTQIGTDPGDPVFDSGDVVVGNHASTHIMWDQSASRLNFRDGADVPLYFSTDGIVLDAATGKFSASSLNWIDGATTHLSIGTEVDLGAVTAAYIETDAVQLNINAPDGGIYLNSPVFVEGTTTYLRLSSLTSTQRDALSATNGILIYNTTTSKVQARAGGSWVDLH